MNCEICGIGIDEFDARQLISNEIVCEMCELRYLANIYEYDYKENYV